jgi:cytoskeletal protein CcmA (bactofilin family)
MLLTRSGLFSPVCSSFRNVLHAPAADNRGASTHFPHGLILKGDLSAEEDMVIEGSVSGGSIDMPSYALTIGPQAQVDARVLARDVTIYGTLRGKVTALEILDIREGAKVAGDLAAPSVALAEGAHVQGRVETKRVDAAMHVARYKIKSAQR